MERLLHLGPSRVRFLGSPRGCTALPATMNAAPGRQCSMVKTLPLTKHSTAHLNRRSGPSSGSRKWNFPNHPSGVPRLPLRPRRSARGLMRRSRCPSRDSHGPGAARPVGLQAPRPAGAPAAPTAGAPPGGERGPAGDRHRGRAPWRWRACVRACVRMCVGGRQSSCGPRASRRPAPRLRAPSRPRQAPRRGGPRAGRPAGGALPRVPGRRVARAGGRVGRSGEGRRGGPVAGPSPAGGAWGAGRAPGGRGPVETGGPADGPKGGPGTAAPGHRAARRYSRVLAEAPPRSPRKTRSSASARGPRA